VDEVDDRVVGARTGAAGTSRLVRVPAKWAIRKLAAYFNPLRVLMPVALALLATTFVKLVADLVRFDLHVAGSTVLVGLVACNIMAIALLADLVVRRTGTT
jgi:hypothetical protein